MSTNERNDLAPVGPLEWECEGRRLIAAESELRAKAGALRALAQSALATGTPDGTVREYLNAVLAFAGMYVGE
jgi:hypothetical protein